MKYKYDIGDILCDEQEIAVVTDRWTENLKNGEYLNRYTIKRISGKYPDLVISYYESTIDIHYKKKIDYAKLWKEINA